jgi:uncharacterized membrane protein
MNLLKKTAAEILENLPAWFIYYTAVFTSFGLISLLKNPRPDYIITAIFPNAVFLLYYYARFKSDERHKNNVNRNYFIIAGITLAILITAIVLARPIRFGNDWASHFDSAITYYEISNIAWTLLLMLHCLKFQGWKKCLLFFGAAFLYGIILESSGVTMGFFFEDHYHLYIPGLSAPVATMFGWSTVFYPCVFILDRLKNAFKIIEERSFVWLGIFAAIIAVSFDALVDPYATDFGLWTWNSAYNQDNSFYWFGVPIVNFISWITAVFSFGIFYYYFEAKTGWDQIKKTAAVFCSIPLVLLMASIIEFSSLGMIEGFNGPSWTILKQYYKDGMPLTRLPEKGKMPGDNNLEKK